ncbi:hypothetical protein CONPUDRAFT_83200 [Coniophora puteana RWD-64-598 SS2]|uniref:Uncharacterized protein n=1 Tax=Coniophora puteana (strain RWD-64-598) TaxID=741705 RepID=A0A5M3MLM5_CONPW|nr:uncharacterized protein CONPUDRAFT_83200 [Coniophora puteana RWD-64-598 SS2]EIW80003.1 hypothetical protein CONPUDRAFT_83200 [Coniophora puteana RWD-64-598 SS2]
MVQWLEGLRAGRGVGLIPQARDAVSVLLPLLQALSDGVQDAERVDREAVMSRSKSASFKTSR